MSAEERLFKRVIARLSVTSEVAAKRPGSTDQRKPSGAEPRGESRGSAERLLSRWESCESTDARHRVLQAALVALYGTAQMLGRTHNEFERGSREWQRAVAMEPGPLRVIAHRNDVSHESVRRWRERYCEK